MTDLTQRIQEGEGADREFYRRVYRRLHPREFPYSPWCVQRQLDDLWPADQEAFCRTVDATLKALSAEGE